MGREICAEKWLPSSVMRVNSVGPPLYLAVMGMVFGHILPKVRSDSVFTFLLRLVMVLPFISTGYFWHDQWSEEATLRELFPALLVLALDRCFSC